MVHGRPDASIWHWALQPTVQDVPMLTPPDVIEAPNLGEMGACQVRQARLNLEPPWVRSLGRLAMDVATEGWRFPVPALPSNVERPVVEPKVAGTPRPVGQVAPAVKPTRVQPPRDAVTLRERLLYVLQPPLDRMFAGRQVELPFKPYPFQMEGIAFLMPRHAALLADEMGLGKTIQTIVAMRLLLHAGLVQRILVVCPKPLVHNWAREMRIWGADVPLEIIGGDADARRIAWRVSNCPVKLVNYELLTRDADYFDDAESPVAFDLVVLDEAQRVKNRDAKSAQVVRSIPRRRSWALTGTPIENSSQDLINLFAFIKPDAVPFDTPVKLLPELTSDSILRRRTEDVLHDLPAKTVHDSYLELTAAQREAYNLAETEGIVRLNALGETVTVQHVFELIMRLKQICNFDPFTGQSAKLEQLHADLAEIADSGRKAIVFSQWVEPLAILARELSSFGPLQYHGRIAATARQSVLETFRSHPAKHVLLMSYGTGSVGLNLQCANYVFLFDRWWNPAVEDQAIKRSHRLGQKEPVFVTRFITQNTIEGRICEVLERKRQLFNELIEHNDAPSKLGMTEQEIFGLFGLRVRPKRLAA